MSAQLEDNSLNIHLKRILLNQQDIEKQLRRLAGEISRDCRQEETVLIGILSGSFMFVADLARELCAQNIHPRINFIALESYGDATSPSSDVRLTKEIEIPLRNKWVLIIDDILDTGHTLLFAKQYLKQFHPKQVKVCVFLDKPARRKVDFEADYCGFRIENEFVVGYGLDWAGRFRDLPYVAVINDSHGHSSIEKRKV